MLYPHLHINPAARHPYKLPIFNRKKEGKQIRFPTGKEGKLHSTSPQKTITNCQLFSANEMNFQQLVIRGNSKLGLQVSWIPRDKTNQSHHTPQNIVRPGNLKDWTNKCRLLVYLFIYQVSQHKCTNKISSVNYKRNTFKNMDVRKTTSLASVMLLIQPFSVCSGASTWIKDQRHISESTATQISSCLLV